MAASKWRLTMVPILPEIFLLFMSNSGGRSESAILVRLSGQHHSERWFMLCARHSQKEWFLFCFFLYLRALKPHWKLLMFDLWFENCIKINGISQLLSAHCIWSPAEWRCWWFVRTAVRTAGRTGMRTRVRTASHADPSYFEAFRLTLNRPSCPVWLALV